jgi:hypothetical protein
MPFRRIVIRTRNDIPFSQFDLDSWAVFTRGGNPSLDRAYFESERVREHDLALGEGERVDIGEV